MGAARHWAAKLDMYRKVPTDLLEGSRRGSIISWMAILVMTVLFFKETSDFLTSKIRKDLHLDAKKQEFPDRIRVLFNITMMDLKCDYVEMDVVSVLGNNQNVTKLINKYPVDAKGVLQRYAARNVHQHDIEKLELHDPKVSKSIEELHESGEDAVSLDAATLQYALDSHDLVFVDFYASWCSHCRALAPTWEMLAKIMRDAAEESIEMDEHDEQAYEEAVKLNVPVFISKIDCVVHHALCVEQAINAYPTLRIFVNKELIADYRGGRTLMELVQYLKFAEQELDRQGRLNLDQVSQSMRKHLNFSAEEQHWIEAMNRTRRHHSRIGWNPNDHPGCQVAGTILINRVPGNFFIQAFSPTHDLAPHMTNVSHEIHSLYFQPEEYNTKVHLENMPANFLDTTRPMNGNVYVTENLHEAYHHYLKLIATNGFAYQVLQSSQLALYRNDMVPEAKFIIDLSPIAVRYRRESRHWYDYVTSLMAIIGGTFTVVGLLEASIRQATRVAELTKQHRRSY